MNIEVLARLSFSLANAIEPGSGFGDLPEKPAIIREGSALSLDLPLVLENTASCDPKNPDCLDQSKNPEPCPTSDFVSYFELTSVMYRDSDKSGNFNNVAEAVGPAPDRYLRVKFSTKIKDPSRARADGTNPADNFDYTSPNSVFVLFTARDSDGLAVLVDPNTKQQLPLGTQLGGGWSWVVNPETGRPNLKHVREGQSPTKVRGENKRTKEKNVPIPGMGYQVNALDSDFSDRVDIKTGQKVQYQGTMGECLPCFGVATEFSSQASDAASYDALKAERGKPTDRVEKPVRVDPRALGSANK